jgi:hypothetical protein
MATVSAPLATTPTPSPNPPASLAGTAKTTPQPHANAHALIIIGNTAIGNFIKRRQHETQSTEIAMAFPANDEIVVGFLSDRFLLLFPSLHFRFRFFSHTRVLSPPR